MNGINWRLALFEVAVVVVGILIAFRVDEWKDHRAERRDVAESLARLADEFVGNRQLCHQMSEDTRASREAVWHVYSSLQEGRILRGDVELFEKGLVDADYIPQILISTLAYREMVASGLLRSLDDAAMASELGALEAEIEFSRLQIPYYRLGPSELASRLRNLVEFRYDTSTDQPRVTFEFEVLAADRTVRNLYFETIDSHSDVAFHLTRICERVRRIDERLDAYFPDRPVTRPDQGR